ncbi:MAG: tyrosine-type recombinase/integrase [Candidatus Acidiferrales bacterium]
MSHGSVPQARQAIAHHNPPLVRGLERRTRQEEAQSLPSPEGRSELRGEDAARSPHKKSPGLGEVGQLAAAWAEGRKDRNAQHVARHLSRSFGHLKAEALTAAETNALLASWRASLATSTTHQFRIHLHAFLAFLAARGGPDLTSTLNRAAVPDARTETFTNGEVSSVLHEANAGMKLFVLLALDAGMRTGTALAITPENWNRQSGVLTFTTKGDRKMSIPATERLADLLNAAATTAQPGESLVHHLTAALSNTERAFRQRWNKIKHTAGVTRDIRPHDLRRTAATRLYNQTKDLRVVQQFLGHRSLLATVKYIAPHDPAALKELLEASKVPWRKVSP